MAPKTTGGALAVAREPVGELVSPAHELVATFALTLCAGERGAKSAQTVRTYRGACERFAGWLVATAGARAGAEQVDLEAVAAYERWLRALGLSEGTIRKDRAAINTWIRFLAEHELIDRGQARLALARKLPSAPSGEPEAPKALSDLEWERLLKLAQARVADDPLLGWRDLAIVRTLGEAGLRAEELVSLERRDVVAKRRGAQLRAIQIRHGKGNRRRRVELAPRAERAINLWDRRRVELGAPPGEPGLPPSRWPLFVTIGRRRRDGSYTRLGHRATYDVLEDLMKRLGRDAELSEELRHAHALRHTFATRYYRRTRDLAGLQRLLGHADPKTTMIYVTDDPAENERLMLRVSDEPPQLDKDREAA